MPWSEGGAADEGFVETVFGFDGADDGEIGKEEVPEGGLDAAVARADDEIGGEDPVGEEGAVESGGELRGEERRSGDIVGGDPVDVIEDGVEAVAVGEEPVVGVGGDDVSVDGVEVHEIAGEGDHVGVDFDGGEVSGG